MYETLGGISGATLGYITHGTRGAMAGWNIGKSLGKQRAEKVSQMAPIPITPASSRKRSISSLGSSTMERPRKYGRSMPLRLSIAKARTRSVRYSGVGAGAVRVIGKRRKQKKKKNVKVSRKLREKIKKVITGQNVKGRTQEIYHRLLRLISTEDNKQIVADLTPCNQAPGNNPNFSISKIVDAASVLWNNKAQVSDPKLITDTGNFPYNKLKVKVIDSSVTYNIRNNTQRKIYCKMIEIKPVSSESQGNPFDGWAAAMNWQIGGPVPLNPVFEGPNQSSTLITELYTNPGMHPDMRKVWNFKTTKFEIPAGAEYKHYVQGPQNKIFDTARYFNGSTFRNYHKDAVFCLFTYHTDLVTTDQGNYGRFMATGADEVALGIVVEAIPRFHLEMPEQAGFVVPPAIVAGSTVANSTRMETYAYKTYPNIRSGVVRLVNDENPVVLASNP